MSRRDELAIAYADARIEVLRLKRDRKACHCECAATADRATGDSGSPPCWVMFKNERDDSRRLAVEEMCPSCQRRQALHEQLHAALRVEASALGKLRRAVAPSQDGER